MNIATILIMLLSTGIGYYTRSIEYSLLVNASICFYRGVEKLGIIDSN